MSISTSYYNKMVNKRDLWRNKTAMAKAENRYRRKENKRFKRERDQYRQDLTAARQEIEALQAQQTVLPARVINDKATLVYIVLRLYIVARISFRGIARILPVLSAYLGLTIKVPCTQTVINWVNRYSIARMQSCHTPIEDMTACLFPKGYILILDASIGLGRGKILTLLALDIEHYIKNPMNAPTLKQVKCIAVSVSHSWTGETIASLLEKVIAQLGKPKGYLKDGGTDLGKAVRLLNEKGIGSVSIDDISHYIANLLKHEYSKHPYFAIFTSTCGKVSKNLKQTLLACLAPPKIGAKAKFMNVYRLFTWANKLLAQSPRGRAAKGSLLEKLRGNMDRLPECKSFINDFLLDASPLITCQALLKNKGMSQQTLSECLPIINSIPNAYIRENFMNWMEQQLKTAVTLGVDQHGLPVCSDCIESLFGVAKRHGTGEIKDANRIAVRIPTLCGEPTWQDAESVLKISVKEQEEYMGSLASLTRQRRNVLNNTGRLEDITEDDQKPDFEVILGSKSGQNNRIITDETVTYENGAVLCC